MKKLVIAVLAVVLVLTLSACGEEGDGQPNEFAANIGQSAAPSGQPAVTVLSAPTGFTGQMADNTGFLLGVHTPDDIAAMFGQPDNIETTSYSSGDVVRYEYSFGAFEFDGTLYYVEGYAGVAGPQGITAGMSLNEVAELFCAGSSARIDGSGEVLLYGDESGDYGKFTRLTEEFVGEYGIYQLDYRAVTDSGKYKLTINLSEDMTMTVFMLQLS